MRVIPSVSLSPSQLIFFLSLRSLTECRLSNACGVHVAAIINTVTSSHVRAIVVMETESIRNSSPNRCRSLVSASFCLLDSLISINSISN